MNNEADNLIRILKDTLSDLHDYSVYHSDIWNEELAEIEEQIKRMETKT